MGADRGPATSAVTIIMLVLASVFVAARLFTRVVLMKSIKQDDWWILAAWLLAVGFSASICVGVADGLGKHKENIPESSFAGLRKAEYAFSILYNPSLMVTKTSIIVFYLSVMSKDIDPIFKWLNWLTLAAVNIAGTALTFANIFQCSPVSAGYKYPAPTGATCTNIVTLFLSSAPINIITDLAILLLPMPILTGMRLPKKQKIILIVTFSFGAFVAVVDVIRIAYLQQASVARLKGVKGEANSGSQITGNNDFSWYASLSFMWSAVEVNLGIICACVPSLKPLFLRFLPSLVKDTTDDISSSGSINNDHANGHSGPPNFRGNVSMVNNPAAFRKAHVSEYSGEDQGDHMGFLNMLAGPDDDAPNAGVAPSRLSRTTTNRSTASDFDFVNMSRSKNMLKLSNTQSVWPIAVVTVIFFLWGFAYGLLDTLNAQFQKVTTKNNVSATHSLGLHAAYFGGYLAGPLTLGRFILKRYGFKASMMAGLCVYGCGTLVFWPSAVLASYTAFIISNIIVGFGLSCLEIAANPYIALCGPLEYAEARLNFSQAFQAVGTVCSPLLASKVLFKNIANAPSLVDVQWTYLGIALFDFALAIVFYYIPLPEATDEDLDELADRRSAVNRTKVGPWKVPYVTLGLAVFSQWCYVGAQESIGNNTQSLMQSLHLHTGLEPFYYQTVAHTVFAMGRFLSAFLNYVMKPRWILLTLYVGYIVTCGLQMGLKGDAAVAIQMLIYLFESGIFAIIFAMAMRGLGAHTKTGSAFVTAAISGGAPFPVIQWAVAQGHGLRYSYCVPLATAVFGMIFPLYLNLVPAARAQVDPIHERRAERRAKRTRRQESIGSELNPNAPTKQFGLAGIIARRKKQHQMDLATAEHIERRSQVGTPNTSEMKSSKSVDFGTIDKPEPVAMKRPQGLVGDLEPWPGGGNESSPRRSQESDVIRRHRPTWKEKDRGFTGDDDDDEEDDDNGDVIDHYHAALKGM